MAPKGFRFSTAEAAIKIPGRRDMALIFSDTEATIAGTFTKNAVKAAPVKISLKKIKSGRAQAVVVNSGNANACTGAQGSKDVRDILSLVSKQLGIQASLSYMCSTGVIGTPLPMERVLPAVHELTESIGTSSLQDVAEAIMTTDTFHKVMHTKFKIGEKTGTISGICKGAGMISPHMATMLCFILTDIAIEKDALNLMLKNSVKKSFNRITVDGDMSTNDTVLMLSNGTLGNTPIACTSPLCKSLQKALDALTYGLSKLIVKDGEGATKLIEVFVKGARNEQEAEKAAFAIADSLLVKTALYGSDANWGRIMAALGYAGVQMHEAKTDIYFNDVKVVSRGVSNKKDRQAARILTSEELKIMIDLRSGRGSVRVLTCDLSEKYVRINAEYRT